MNDGKNLKSLQDTERGCERYERAKGSKHFKIYLMDVKDFKRSKRFNESREFGESRSIGSEDLENARHVNYLKGVKDITSERLEDLRVLEDLKDLHYLG